MDVRFDEEKNIVHIKPSGQLDRKTILGAFDSTVSDERYTSGMRRLWDLRDADLSSLDSQTINEMAQYSLKFPPGIRDVKVALVTSRDLEFGLSRMFEMASRALTPIAVFRSIEKAEEWMTE